ncbi:MAG TPA: type II toxin-antitoxin system VapC family toxin [Vicinamibacterales bacterium]|jgi:PIN domain nuclease of toxin-antitoxin system
MTTAPLLDTHVWIWWVTGDSRLGKSIITALDALPANDRPFLSDVSLLEAAVLVGQKRLILPVPFDEWVEAAAHPRSVRSVPISPPVALGVARLAGRFRDPADRVIVATSETLNLPLLTRDKAIIRSRLVRRWTPTP